MTTEMEPIVKKFYAALEENKFLGRKCCECGAIDFPPHLACNECGYHKTEWTEVSGKGMVLDFVLPGVQNSRPYLSEKGDYSYGSVRIEEGAEYTYVIYGISSKNAAEMRERIRRDGGIPCHAETFQRDGWKELVFVLD